MLLRSTKPSLAAEFLKGGGIVAYPTETFYGLGVDATREDAIRDLYRFKGREDAKPFPLLLPSTESLRTYLPKASPLVQTLVERFWPGPLTLVLPLSTFPASLTNPGGGVGVRVSPNPTAAALLRAFGGPITATSANRSGEPTITDPAELERRFRDHDILLLDGGKTLGGKPSTVVDVTDPKHPALLREGVIPWRDVVAALGGDLHG